MALDYLKVQPDYVKLMNKHFTVGRAGEKIQFITRHHLAMVGDGNAVWWVWQSRAASAHYVIANDGKVWQLVWDKDTAWANANQTANRRTIAIEHSNAPGADYPISDVVIVAGARWAAALCLFYGLGRPVFGKNIRDHREFTNTSCPYHLAKGGKYHQRWMQVAQEFYDELVRRKNGAAAKPAPAKTQTVTTQNGDKVTVNLDTQFTSFVPGSDFKASLATFIMTADRAAFEGLQETQKLTAKVEEQAKQLAAMQAMLTRIAENLDSK